MRKILFVMITSAFVGALSAAEIKVAGELVIPTQDDDWDKGYGVSAQVIFGSESGFGFALSAGVQKWDVNDKVYSFGQFFQTGTGYGYAVGLDGDVTIIPVGASLLYKIPLADRVSVVLEGGIRYAIVDSNVKFVGYESSGNSYYYDIDFDDGVIGLLGAEFDVELTDSFHLQLGAGYQLDVVKGDAKIGDEKLDYKNKLEAAFVKLGIALSF